MRCAHVLSPLGHYWWCNLHPTKASSLLPLYSTGTIPSAIFHTGIAQGLFCECTVTPKYLGDGNSKQLNGEIFYRLINQLILTGSQLYEIPSHDRPSLFSISHFRLHQIWSVVQQGSRKESISPVGSEILQYGIRNKTFVQIKMYYMTSRRGDRWHHVYYHAQQR